MQLPGTNDRETEPLQSLHPGAQTLLNQLNIGEAIAYASRGTYTGIRVSETVSPLRTVGGEVWIGNHVDPGVFAAYCVKQAQLMGVQVMYEARVNEIMVENRVVSGIILANGEKIYSSYVVDATGARRFAGRYLNFEEQVHSLPLICYTGNSLDDKGDHREKDTAIFTPDKSGWKWEAFSSSGYYTWTKLVVKNGGPKLNIKQSEGQNGRISGGDMQWRVFRPVVCPGMLMVGDAAGLLDPAAGQGILNGLLSGIMGAETIIKCTRQPLIANWYLTQYDTWFINLYHKKAGMLKKKYAEMDIAIN